MTTTSPIPQYQHTLPEIMKILKLFYEHNLSYILFKCDHIFEGQNKNVDILFETEEGYRHAAQLLQNLRFKVRLSEKIERYKTMYTGIISTRMISIHLHRQIAWHGMIALDKQLVFSRKKTVAPLIIIPGMEDSILIHGAHSLFENFRITEKEGKYLSHINDPIINSEYLYHQATAHHWKRALHDLSRYVRQAQEKGKQLPVHLPASMIYQCWLRKAILEPDTARYLMQKLLWRGMRGISFTPKGTLITISGVNGSGKSTLSKRLLQDLESYTHHLGTPSQYYYFGWKASFPFTKALSWLLKRMHRHTFQEKNIQAKKVPSFSLTQEALFLYLFGEFLYRYYAHLYPALRRGELIISDRYFYDIYGQYLYAHNSRILPFLLKLFPTPTAAYVLDAPLPELMNRKKTKKDAPHLEEEERKVLPPEYLKAQQEQFRMLSHQVHAKNINSNRNINQITTEIMHETWTKLI